MSERNGLGTSAPCVRFLSGIIVFAAFLAASCVSFQVSGMEVPAQRTEGTIVGHFDTKVWVHKFIGEAGGNTLANIGTDSIDLQIRNAIRDEVLRQGGTRAVDVKIEYGAPVTALLVNWLTFWFYAPAEAHITGIIIK